MKEHPPPTFALISCSCMGSKFTQMSAHAGGSFTRSLRYFTVTTRQLCVDRRSKRSVHSELRHAYGDGAVQSVVCHEDSTSKLLMVLLSIIICPVICFEGIKSLLTWHGCSFVIKCRNTQKTTHSPLWQTCNVLRPWVLFCETAVLYKLSCAISCQYWVALMLQVA